MRTTCTPGQKEEGTKMRGEETKSSLRQTYGGKDARDN